MRTAGMSRRRKRSKAVSLDATVVVSGNGSWLAGRSQDGFGFRGALVTSRASRARGWKSYAYSKVGTLATVPLAVMFRKPTI